MPISVKNKTYFLLFDIIISSVNKIKGMQLCFSKKEFNIYKTDKNDVWNAEIPSAAKRSIYGTNSKYIGAEWPPPNWVGKKTLSNLVKFQTTNTCTYVAAKKWSHCETVALWNSLGTCKTSSIPMRCHWKPNCQLRSSLSLVHVVAVFNVDTARLPCAFAPIFMVRSYFQCCCQSI